MKIEGLNRLSDNDIITKRAELMRELMALQIQLRMQQLENTSKIKKTRRAVARLNTELRAREIAQNLPKGTLLGRSVAKAHDEATGAEAEGTGKRSRFGFGLLKDALLGRKSDVTESSEGVQNG